MIKKNEWIWVNEKKRIYTHQREGKTVKSVFLNVQAIQVSDGGTHYVHCHDGKTKPERFIVAKDWTVIEIDGDWHTPLIEAK
jgi:hypothetical protein